MTSWFDDDDRLADELGLALAETRPDGPTDMIMVGYDIVMTDSIEAVLVHDSEADAVAAVRSTAADLGARQLTFEADGVEIDVELVDGRVVGHVDPASGGTVTLDQPTAPEALRPPAVEPDELGGFEFELRHPGSFRVRYRASDGRTVATSWIDGPHPVTD